MGQNNDYSGVIVGVVLIVILLAILFGTAWGQSLRGNLGLGDPNATSTTILNNDTQTQNNNGNSVSTTTVTNSTTTATTSTSTATSTNPNEVAFRIKMSALPQEQQTMLRTAGITGDEIEITNAMRACAERSIGVNRTREISTGSNPSIVEGAKLVACYNA